MGKYVIECPHCQTLNDASTFLFAKKVIKCGNCQKEIDTRKSRLIAKTCPHCNKTYIYDQVNTEQFGQCPSCGKAFNIYAANKSKESRMTIITCPQCFCSLEIDGSLDVVDCPVCDCHVDVRRQRALENLVKENTVSTIQYEGDNTTLIWKHPIVDFNLGSQLIVHETQEVVLFINGEALDSFGPGRYSLDTSFLPFFNKAFKLPTDKKAPFHAEVYFINLAVQMGMKWGTDSRVRFIDPKTSIPLDIGACGELNLQVVDGRKLMLKIVGTTSSLTGSQLIGGMGTSDDVSEVLRGFFHAPLMTVVKNYLSGAIRAQDINIFEIDAHLLELSDELRNQIDSVFAEYGLSISQFYVTNVSLPEESPSFKRLKQLHAEAYLGVQEQEVRTAVKASELDRTIMEESTSARVNIIKAQAAAESQKVLGMAEAEIMKAKGYDQKDVITADVQKAFAEGLKGSGGGGGAGRSLATDIIGAIAGIKIAGDMAGKLSQAINPVLEESSGKYWDCSCGERKNTGRFCMSCGAPRIPIAEKSVWKCQCGHGGNIGRYCSDCGMERRKSE